MTIGHMDDSLRPFKPTNSGGGSEKGKPQSNWPLVLLVGADAIVLRAKGTTDAWEKDRKLRIDALQFRRQMDTIFPGWALYVSQMMPYRVTPLIRLLANRVYKMYYNGTSNGNMGDIMTRARKSKEHWGYKVPDGHPIRLMHDQIYRGQVAQILGWRDLV